MPTIILRVDDDDHAPEGEPRLYVGWSTVVEAPIAWGDQEYLATHLIETYPDTDSGAAERFERANQYGTSDQSVRYGRWGDELMYQQQGTIGRPRLREMLVRFTADERADVTDLLTPLEDG